jgi:hypothetical protein
VGRICQGLCVGRLSESPMPMLTSDHMVVVFSGF